MMGNVSALICLLLLIARGEVCAAQSERPLPQWLSGLIAVSSFLLLVFIGFLLKKIWCDASEARTGRSSSQDDLCDRDLTVLEIKKSGDVTNDIVAREGKTVVYDKSLEVLRGWRQEEKETITERVYDTSLDVLSTEDDSHIYNTTLYETTEDKATAM